ncbi:hypothetical protein JQ628_28655 [Bradyrhizobium lablabi]|uniref:hypothetical protein n=1 Tax=Bradyrhizobium lablabi TaxID=722472 RepID=UPI001BA6EBFD|nr:hypothetical protein [Bradyrhizobium lablabi]MBR1125523.1 hypothetical protein [Bradyrhizobium lablabi]
MHSREARTAPSRYSLRIHPALASFGDEVCGTLARLIAYVCSLALIAILGIYLWDQIPPADPEVEPSARVGWSAATRSTPAFAVSQFDLAYRSDAYRILRHPEGGRKDVLRWLGPDGKPAAELEIYRAGGELDEAAPTAGHGEAAGIIDSKFGAVTLRLMGETAGQKACLSFRKRIEQPHVLISGWSCQGDTLPARRTAIACTLNRLALVSAGNDQRLAELFAHAELRRNDCAAASAPAQSADWVTGTDNPHLRAAF